MVSNFANFLSKISFSNLWNFCLCVDFIESVGKSGFGVVFIYLSNEMHKCKTFWRFSQLGKGRWISLSQSTPPNHSEKNKTENFFKIKFEKIPVSKVSIYTSCEIENSHMDNIQYYSYGCRWLKIRQFQWEIFFAIRVAIDRIFTGLKMRALLN